MLVPSTYDKLALKSKRCYQCNNPVVKTSADLQKSTPYTFTNLLIHYMPKVYFLAFRSYDSTMGDTFLEIINTTENEMRITVEPYSKEGLELGANAEAKPIEGAIDLAIKESLRDELVIIDDIRIFDKLPKTGKSALIKCKKNCAIVQLALTIKPDAPEVVVPPYAVIVWVVHGDAADRHRPRKRQGGVRRPAPHACQVVHTSFPFDNPTLFPYLCRGTIMRVS